MNQKEGGPDDGRYVDLVARYYGDPEFRARMDRDPAAVMKAEGFDVPEDATIRLLFDRADLMNIVLPAPGPDPPK